MTVHNHLLNDLSINSHSLFSQLGLLETFIIVLKLTHEAMFPRLKVQRIIHTTIILLSLSNWKFKAFSSNTLPKSNKKQLPNVTSLTWKSISDQKLTRGTDAWFKNSPHELPHGRWTPGCLRKHKHYSLLASNILQISDLVTILFPALLFFPIKRQCCLEFMCYIISYHFHLSDLVTGCFKKEISHWQSLNCLIHKYIKDIEYFFLGTK